MKLTKCLIDVVMLPTRRPHRWTGLGTSVIGHYPIIRLETDEGLVGLGEAPVLRTWGGDHGKYFGEDIETTIHLIRDVLFPRIKGEDPVQFKRLRAEMNSEVAGYPYAKSAVEMAMLDITGKKENKPLYDLLGGKVREGTAIFS